MARLAARGEDALRIFASYGERSLPIIIEYVRPNGGAAFVDVRIYEEHRPHLVTRLPDPAFAAVWSRWNDQPRMAAAGEAAQAALANTDAKAGVETVCFPRVGGAWRRRTPGTWIGSNSIRANPGRRHSFTS
jgi:hypothetical protein